LEFLGLLGNDSAEDAEKFAGEPGGLVEVASPVARVVGGDNEILAQFLQKHQAYLQQKELEIKRLRYEIQEIRQSRKEIELLILREVLGRSG
jgi:hypothetical protein